jgi:hypothetical protein
MIGLAYTCLRVDRINHPFCEISDRNSTMVVELKILLFEFNTYIIVVEIRQRRDPRDCLVSLWLIGFATWTVSVDEETQSSFVCLFVTIT